MSLEPKLTPFASATNEGASSPTLPTEPAEQLAAQAELQARYREEYLRQLRRQSCPGCGEDISVF